MSSLEERPQIKARLKRRIDAALGLIKCDLVIRDVIYLDVFSCQWRHGDIAIHEGSIIGLDPGLKAHRVVEGKQRHLVPGFIDAHVHLESSLMMPGPFAAAVLPRGTTTAISDPHELANVQGVSGIQFFLDASERLALDLRVMLSSCVPATHLETNGAGSITASQLLALVPHKNALGLAEVMNVPGVLNGDPEMLDKLLAFEGRPLDGHCPLVTGRALAAYASTGISSCHESSQLEEAREKLRHGIAVWIREGSVAKDLDTLVPLLDLATSTSMGFCTDDRNPLDILTEGHLDCLIRGAIKGGVVPEVAYRTASWSVARHYGLHQGGRRTGAIAPGYRADLVLLDDLKTCAVSQVLQSGRLASELDFNVGLPSGKHANTIKAALPEAEEVTGPSGQVHVIGVTAGKIVTDHLVLPHNAPGVARLTVLERHGRGGKPSNGYVCGFGERLCGAIASSVGHDSHNLIVVGSDPLDMRAALAALMDAGGGFCVVKQGQVLASLALPFGGLMSDQGAVSLKESLERLKQASRSIGCVLPEPFLQLAFLSLPVIPSLKLTDKGLVDVDRFEIINVRV